jgi:two-component system response regulator AtoC
MSEHARILVIDDDENVRKGLALALKERGYIVDVAKDGKEAVEKSQAAFFNLALIDIRLPDMDGIELLTALRDTIPKMIKIIVTGYPSLENAMKAVNKGADGYILKPVDMDRLVSTIERHLRRQQEAREYSEEKVKEYIETRAKEARGL